MTPLTVDDTLAILRRLGPVASEIVLVGGQALHFWAEVYRAGAPELHDKVFTSKDVDFFGGVEHARKAAEALGGECRQPPPDDSTVNSALVSFTDEHGTPRELDFLRALAGVSPSEIESTALNAVPEEGLTFKVLHPLLCLKSRVANVMQLGRRSEHARRQLEASLVCMREYLAAAIADDLRGAFYPNAEALFRYARSDLAARDIYRDEELRVDVFVLPPDETLPEAFRERRLPRMRAQLKAKREAHAKINVAKARGTA